MTEGSLAGALLKPRSVALVGASADPKKTTARAQRYLRRHGYRGRIWPINPRHREICGEPVLASLAELPEPVDHAFILVAAETVSEVVAECGHSGIPCATILAGGFSERGAAGQARQDRLVARARERGVRLLGPNSMGVINLSDRIALSVNAALDAPSLCPGRLGVLSHSGSMLGALLSRGQARGIGFSKLVSMGNEADLGIGEIGEMLVDDPATDAILLFLETIRQPDRIEAMARRAAAEGKPVIAYMLGRSQAGRDLAAAHTGALVGPDESAEAFLKDCGILRVDFLETLFELPLLVAKRRPPETRPKTPTKTRTGPVAVVTTTGAGGAMVIDRLALAGVEVAAPPSQLVAGLAERGVNIGPGRLSDLTLEGTRPEVMGAVLDAFLASSHCQVVVVVVGSSAQFAAELAVQPIIDRAGADKPLAVFLAPQAEESLTRLAVAGIAAFRTPESCAEAVRALLQWRPPGRCERPPLGDPAQAARALAEPQGSNPLWDETTALAAFAALGVPCVETHTIRDLEDFSDADAVTKFPVVAKILSPDIAHKAEAGGVVTAIPDTGALRAAARRILAAVAVTAPKARRGGILVQPLESGLAEAFLGFRIDPRIGPVVALGLGGALAEIYRDITVRRAPVSMADAEIMIEEVRGLAPLRQDRGDVSALARAICAFSDLARLPACGLGIAEINPLIVKAPGHGVVAVDGLVVRAKPAG